VSPKKWRDGCWPLLGGTDPVPGALIHSVVPLDDTNQSKNPEV
jgi:hypothetical protein